jgi:hypothetical protein
MKKNDNNAHGLGLTSVLLILFVVLKLCGLISWSWLWVLSPVWIPLSIALIALGFLLFISKKSGYGRKY